MKLLLMLLLILLICLSPAVAAAASPIWSVSIGLDGSNANYFASDFGATNRWFQNYEPKYLTASATVSNGTRFSVGYGFGRNEALGYEGRAMMAGVDKKINENWWVTVGYESGRNPFSSFTVGAVYSISPNAAVSFGSSFNTNDYELKNAIIRTQLYIHF